MLSIQQIRDTIKDDEKRTDEEIAKIREDCNAWANFILELWETNPEIRRKAFQAAFKKDNENSTNRGIEK